LYFSAFAQRGEFCWPISWTPAVTQLVETVGQLLRLPSLSFVYLLPRAPRLRLLLHQTLPKNSPPSSSGGPGAGAAGPPWIAERLAVRPWDGDGDGRSEDCRLATGAGQSRGRTAPRAWWAHPRAPGRRRGPGAPPGSRGGALGWAVGFGAWSPPFPSAGPPSPPGSPACLCILPLRR